MALGDYDVNLHNDSMPQLRRCLQAVNLSTHSGRACCLSTQSDRTCLHAIGVFLQHFCRVQPLHCTTLTDLPILVSLPEWSGAL